MDFGLQKPALTPANPEMGKVNTFRLKGIDQAMALPASHQRLNPGFAPFVHHVQPDPPPSQRSFFTEEILKNWRPGMRQGGEDYQKKLKKNPLLRGLVWASGIGLGLIMSAFGNPSRDDINRMELENKAKNELKDQIARLKDTPLKDELAALEEKLAKLETTALKHVNLRKYVQIGFMAALMVYPVWKANQIFPQLEDAYQKTMEGNPTEGRRQFRQSFQQVSTSIFHAFLKPLSVAGLACLTFLFPKILKNPTGVTQMIVHTVTSILFKLRLPTMVKGNRVAVDNGLLKKIPDWKGIPWPKINPDEPVPTLYQTFKNFPPFKVLDKLHQKVTGWGLGLEKRLAIKYDWL